MSLSLYSSIASNGAFNLCGVICVLINIVLNFRFLLSTSVCDVNCNKGWNFRFFDRFLFYIPVDWSIDCSFSTFLYTNLPQKYRLHHKNRREKKKMFRASSLDKTLGRFSLVHHIFFFSFCFNWL